MKIDAIWLRNFRKLAQMIRDNGGEARFVGGCVRDVIIERAVSDFDLASTLTPEEGINCLNKNNIRCIPTGMKHGTFTALISSIPVEITTLRKDINCDGRHADVFFTKQWEEDASRRDFTFNALYLDIDGNVYDYFSGLEDLKYRRLRFVGNASQRIQEDYLRILRAFRFQANICTQPISDEILSACNTYRDNIDSLSGERIQGEMLKFLSYENFVDSLQKMQECKVLEKIINNQIDFHTFSNTETIKNGITSLALIIRNIKGNPLNTLIWISGRWKLSRKLEYSLRILIENNLDQPLAVLLSRIGSENTQSVIKIALAENKISEEEYQELLNKIMCSEIPQFPIMGGDLSVLGYEGKQIGIEMKELRLIWEKSCCKFTKKDLLKLAVQHLNSAN